MSIITRLVNRLRGRRLEQDLHDEVDFHIDMRAAQHMKAGMSQEDAMKRAPPPPPPPPPSREECLEQAKRLPRIC